MPPFPQHALPVVTALRSPQGGRVPCEPLSICISGATLYVGMGCRKVLGIQGLPAEVSERTKDVVLGDWLSRLPPTHCNAPGCDRATTGRKPYCEDHVHRMPYRAQVASEVAEREREAHEVAAGGEVDPDGLRATEIVWLVSEAPLDLRSLTIMTELRRSVLKRYLAALRAAGKVTIFRNPEKKLLVGTP